MEFPFSGSEDDRIKVQRKLNIFMPVAASAGRTCGHDTRRRFVTFVLLYFILRPVLGRDRWLGRSR